MNRETNPVPQVVYLLKTQPDFTVQTTAAKWYRRSLCSPSFQILNVRGGLFVVLLFCGFSVFLLLWWCCCFNPDNSRDPFYRTTPQLMGQWENN